MRFRYWHFIHIFLIFISFLGTTTVFAQERYPFITPTIDSICHTTLEYVQMKNLLLRQQEQVGREAHILENVINSLNQEHSEIVAEQQIIESELEAINRHLDSLTPKRPDGPRPKTNIIDIINEGLSLHGNYGLNINQLALSNWAAGGESSATGKAFANFTLIDQRKAYDQKLTGAFAFGIARFADKRIEKQDDKIDLTYALSLHRKQKLNFSAVATFNTQFADGYKYPNDSTRISGFMAPGYLTISAGATYKTKDERFQAYLSPMAGKMTFVTIQELADQGAFGVQKGYYDEDSLWIPGKHLVPALGVNLIINYTQPIGKNIKYTTMLNAYYNYTEHRDDDYFHLDFNWENTVNFIISKHLTTVLFINLKYDHNTKFPVYETIDGVETIVDNVPKLQVKESLGIAFIHRF